MKISELLNTSAAESDLEDAKLEDIYVRMSAADLEVLGISLALESVWQDSGDKDWHYRIDGENPSIPAQRHIHIARKKHTSSKNMQAAWNIDGTRHDRKSFNTSVGDQDRVKRIARAALGLPSNVALESADSDGSAITLLEEASVSTDGKTAYLKMSVK